MAVRVRYIKTRKPGVFKSQRNFYSDRTKGTYRTYINIEEMTYRVVNIRSETAVRSTELDRIKKPSHINTLKKQVKRAMKSLGIVFNIEIRDR